MASLLLLLSILSIVSTAPLVQPVMDFTFTYPPQVNADPMNPTSAPFVYNPLDIVTSGLIDSSTINVVTPSPAVFDFNSMLQDPTMLSNDRSSSNIINLSDSQPAIDSFVQSSTIIPNPFDSTTTNFLETATIFQSDSTNHDDIVREVTRDAPNQNDSQVVQLSSDFTSTSLYTSNQGVNPLESTVMPVVVQSTLLSSQSGIPLFYDFKPIEDPVLVVNSVPVQADVSQGSTVSYTTVAPLIVMPVVPFVPQQPQLDAVNDGNHVAYQYLNLTDSMAQNFILNISLPSSMQTLLFKLKTSSNQMEYTDKLDMALQLTALAHDLMTSVDADLSRQH